MLSVTAAETLIQSLVIPLSLRDGTSSIEQIPLDQALHRILAQPVSSSLDFPHWDNSAMDGYAFRYTDAPQAIGLDSAGLRVVETIAAGECPQQSLQPGEASRIFTGAMMPPGADTIIPQEATLQKGDRVYFSQAPEHPGAFVRQQGDYYRAGTPLLPPGVRLEPADLAVLAAAQGQALSVYRSLRVAILSTGNELVSPYSAAPLPPGRIVDSNQIALTAAVQRLGAIPVPLGIVPDEPALLQKTIARVLPQVDVILSSGGVSVGDYDYIDGILAELGAELHIRSVAMKPGKPLTVATFPQISPSPLYFGLPGNPVSALVSFWRFVQPALEKMSGQHPLPLVYFKTGYTTQTLESDGQRETYLWGRVEWRNETQPGYWFTPATGSKSSGNLIHLSQTQALAQIPIGQKHIPAGSRLSLRLL